MRNIAHPEHRSLHSNHEAYGLDDLGRAAMVVGGGALAYYGVRRGGPLGIGLLALGGALVGAGAARPVAEHWIEPAAWRRRIPAAASWARPLTIMRSITIARPRAEVYRFWRDFQNLPRFMRHVERIDVLSERRSHWVVRAPMGQTVEWDAELEDERENERLAWRSAEGAQIRNAGEVVFREAPDGRGTEVHATISYEPPGGRLGHVLAKLWGEDPDRQARDDLRRLKQLMETGEIATATPQPAGVH